MTVTTAFASHPATAPSVPTVRRRLDFANTAEWITERDVALIDAHVLTDESGQGRSAIDGQFLQEVAANNNRRYERTGDATPGVVGHTTDNPNDPERPVRCWFTDFKVRPGPDGRPTLYANQHVKKKFAHILEDFPRRSVELWVGKREIDPVALLGGTTPERDLGVTRYHRDLDAPVLRYSRSAGDYCYHYSMESPMPLNGYPATGNGYPIGGGYPAGNGYPSYPSPATSQGRPVRYFDDGSEKTQDGPPGGGGDEGGGDDPMIAKLLASAGFKEAIRSIVEQAIEEAMGGDEGPDDMGDMGGMGDEMGGAPPMPPGAGAPPGGPPMPPPGGPGGPRAEEAAEFHSPPPVKFDAMGGGYPSGSNSFIPDEGGMPPRRMSHHLAGDSPMNFHRHGYATAVPGYPPYAPAPRAAADPTTPARLSRVEAENKALKLRLARADAAQYVRSLQDDGFVIEDPSYLTESLASFDFVPNGVAARNEFIEKIVKKNFARKENDPTAPVDLVRFSRTPTDTQRAAAGPQTQDDTSRLVRYARENNMTGNLPAAWAAMHGAAQTK